MFCERTTKQATHDNGNSDHEDRCVNSASQRLDTHRPPERRRWSAQSFVAFTKDKHERAASGEVAWDC